MLQKTWFYAKRTFMWLMIAFFGSSILFVILYKYVQVPASPLMFIRCGQQVMNGEQLRMKHEWVPLDSISADLPLAVWASEDQNFMKHNGFDFEAIKQALLERDRRIRGGSTISQQVAKNVFLWPSSTWVRKGFEAYFTVLIELVWGKERIMEVYLNTIEMGDGIYGAEAVAVEHFGVHAKDLTRNQCALIAATLPNPIRFDSSHPSSYMYRRQSWILRQMRWLGTFPREESKEE
ncbi:MAG: monofunctional biosynthetic peptidoglycan transglycosylase [Bacteroidaceae bacterium]|nr:monofunctional biosynthetic peptidoglycan transglycosylase [Bacteroidaceae bacterium]